MKKAILSFLSLAIVVLSAIAQEIPSVSKAEDRLKGYEKRQAISLPHVLQNVEFTSIGPTIMGGRVTDIEVNPVNANEYYIAYASGGLWHTINNGQSYRPLFDSQMVMSIGDIAVDWEGGSIWLGSGENNSSRSSYSGFGIYLSTDSGRTWEHRGLSESHHIGRIVLHPNDPEKIYVAVIGHLYSPNEERGVYRSSNGGNTWEKTLYIDENTGAIDLLINPASPDVLYAALWHRKRMAWDFQEGGQASGVYRSKDGGDHWQSMTNAESGFPEGLLGRIGLAISPDGEQLYALLDNQNERPKEKKEEVDGLTKEMLSEMTSEEFLNVKEKDLKIYLEKNDFPKELSADSIRSLIMCGDALPRHLVDFIEDANQHLFETEVIGAELYSCNESTGKWTRTHQEYLDDFVYTYGYYFGQVRVSPLNEQHIYITGVPLLKSSDGGKTFISISGDNQHADHHALWISPSMSGHLINGNDGGINISYDGGLNWTKVNSPPVGQFYTVFADQSEPYNVYGGLQDNGVWMGPSNYKLGTAWQSIGRYPYKRIMGGDGFQVEVDSRDNKTVYTGFQFGHYYRFNSDGGRKTNVTPAHKFGQRPLRFNWQTPIHLSRHNQDVLYFGSNKFHRSLNQGNKYDLVSRDLTKGGKKGDIAYGTLSTIDESPLMFGLIYVGSDDGLVHVSHDLGNHWERIDHGLPEDMWVSRVEASNHDTDRVYLSLNGYRWDNFESMIYRSDDRGKNWSRIGLDLPLEPVNVILEDAENERILYVGTDNGLYISLDGGDNFLYMGKGLPAVSVHDLYLQSEKGDLLVGTHGRSIFRANVTELQQLSPLVMKKGIHFFKLPSVNYNENWGKQWNNWGEFKKGAIMMPVYVNNKGKYQFRLQSEKGLILKEWSQDLDKGLNYPELEFNIDEKRMEGYKKQLKKKSPDMENLKKADNGKYYLVPGDYRMVVKNGITGESSMQKLVINGKNESDED
ncbi:MAG: glycosyl hydrolase [Vicingaceae bacterium]